MFFLPFLCYNNQNIPRESGGPPAEENRGAGAPGDGKGGIAVDWQTMWANFLQGLTAFVVDFILAAIIFFGGWLLAKLAA